jgi:FkbM family methyltransferase
VGDETFHRTVFEAKGVGMTAADVSTIPMFDPDACEKVEVRSGDRTFTMTHQDRDDHIFRILRTSAKFYESELLETLRRFVEPGDLVVDVGANIGNHTVFLAGVCGCRVLAVEPHPLAFAILSENIRANNLQSLVTAHRVALGREKGSADFEPMTVAHNLGGSTLRIDGHGVEIATLDELLAGRRARLLKIDVEGMELSVLRGAERALRKGRPLVCVEAKEEAEFAEVFDYLSGFGLFVGSVHNFSPTHVFLPSRLFKLAPILAELSRFLGSFFIRNETSISDLRRRLAHLETQVARLSASQKVEPKG